MTEEALEQAFNSDALYVAFATSKAKGGCKQKFEQSPEHYLAG
ncbi:MAG: hypothetical protein ACRD72_05635 [Candidatus Angelobacter sp.]